MWLVVVASALFHYHRRHRCRHHYHYCYKAKDAAQDQQSSFAILERKQRDQIQKLKAEAAQLEEARKELLAEKVPQYTLATTTIRDRLTELRPVLNRFCCCSLSVNFRFSYKRLAV
jgi:hypothetical protein